jgi:hypothetical protein
MTTIVCNLEGMAADTRVTGPLAYYPATKIFRIRDSLFGTAGHGDMCLAFIHWAKAVKRDPLKLHELIGKEYDRDDISILELNPTGIYKWSGWGFPEKVLADTAGVGSGHQAALAVLRAGKTPEEAIRIAMDHDEYTGCDVQVEYLLPPELLPKRKRKGK